MVGDNKVHALAGLIQAHTVQYRPIADENAEGSIDLGFFRLSIADSLTADQLLAALMAAFEQRTGDFAEIDLQDFCSGPSYITLGAWLGDQGTAISLIGAGALLGLWDVASPETLGIHGPEADQMRGMGFLFPSVGADSPLTARKQGVA